MPLTHRSDAVLAGLAGAKWANAKWIGAAFAGFAHVAAPAAVAALWQGALVALALVLCLRFVLRVSAEHRFAAWAVGFAVAAGLPLLPLFEHSSAVIATVPPGAVAATPWLELDSRWGFAIAALWLAASTFRAAELALNLLRLRRLWRGATPVQAEETLRSLLAAALPARRIEICTTRALDRPSVIGFFAPRILIPEWLYSRLTPGELEQVALHEAEHLRRRDDWTNLLQKLFLVVFPLNPALAWMERRLCREREMACDEGVVQRTQAPRTYAACLASIAERGLQRRELQRRELLRRAQALSLGVLSRRPELVRRVDSILRRKKARHPLAAGALVGVVGCGLVVGALELSRSPQLVAFVAAPNTAAVQLAVVAPHVLAPSRTGTPGITETHGIARVSYARASESSPTAADAVFHPSQNIRAAIRAIDAKAVVPTIRNAVVTHATSRPRRSEDLSARVTETAMVAADSAPRDVPVNAATPTSAETAGQGQEFLVLTAWEEVQTSAPSTVAIADYENGASDQAHAATGQSDATRDARITVMRLILLVYPANAAGSPAGAAAGTKPARTTGSHSHRPTASTFDGGWLFFQL